MYKRLGTGLTLATLVTFSALAQDVQSVLRDASKALSVDNVKSLKYSATGYEYAFGQAPNTNAPWPKFIDKSYTRVIDYTVPASKVERVRVQGENPPHGGGGQPLVGEQTQSQTIVVDSTTPWAQQLEIWITPHGFLRAAAAKNASVAAKTVAGKKYQVVSFVGDNHAKVNGYINEQNLVERVETWIDAPVLGDTLYEVTYSDYKDVGGTRFPQHIVQKQGDHPIYDLTVNDVKVNAGEAIQAAPAPQPPAAIAQSEKLGEGIYLITGGYSVIAIDFKDHLTLLEAGQNEARATAVIAEAKRLFPNKPIKYVVNTHPHFDHSGGLRTFVAEGSTILTYQSNQSYLQKVLAGPHTLNPDKAAQVGAKPKVESVGEKKVLTDGERVVELYHLKDFLHQDGTLIAYLPKEKVLFEADAYNPQPTTAVAPNPPSVFTTALLDNIDRLKLDVVRIVPVHYPADNRVVTLDELKRWVGKKT
jgi:glyoxylase-like metal-dependent hydrolase (beta-lactamase superfamily II)